MAEFQRGVFVRCVREAYGLTQEELAEKMGVTQSALARFERSKTSLKPVNLEKLAAALGLSLEYLATGQGSPFVASASKQPVKLFLSEGQYGMVDASLLFNILDQSKHSVVVFVIPDFNDEKLTIYRRGGTSHLHVAILVKGYNDVSYIFKRKTNILFDSVPIKKILKAQYSNCVEIYDEILNKFGMDMISKWDHIDLEYCNNVIKTVRKIEDRRTLRFMIDAIWAHVVMAEEKNYGKRISEQLNNMTDDEVQEVLKNLLPRLAEEIKICIL